MSDDEVSTKINRKKRKILKNEFIDDEAELSGDDLVSEDEVDLSDDDQIDLDLVDKEAPDLNSDEEEEVRELYHKQLEVEDKRTVLLLQEQLEDKDVSIGQRRRRKFRWQTKELMENSLKRHYDPDDDDSQEADDDEDLDYEDLKPRLRRPTAESLLIGSTRILTEESIPASDTSEFPKSFGSSSRSLSKALQPVAGPSGFSDDSNSNTLNSRLTSGTRTNTSSDLNRFLFRDKELVEALSTRETVIASREEKDKLIQREIRRVLQSKSIFDQLYS